MKRITISILVFSFTFISLPFIFSSTSSTENETDAGVQKILLNSHYIARVSLFMSLPKHNNSIVFLGDSLTERCEWGELLGRKDIVNRGISGDTTAGIMNRLDHIIGLRPRAVFLMVGVNDLLKGSPVERTASRYKTILDALTKAMPGRAVRVQSVMPTTNPELNEKIEQLNGLLKEISNAHLATYIDINGPLRGQDGLIKKGYTFDGLHLSGEGYHAWKKAIAPYLN